MNFVERPVLFECEGERLVGVISEPEQAASVAVIVIVGGPQYRAGSHRQFVRLARCIAAAGYPVLRFDYRGMGDSTGPARTFEECTPDVAAALAALRTHCPGVQRVVLWGLCDGASAALDYWHSARDATIAGMVLLNPWVRSETTLAKAHIKHYYVQRVLAREFWAKLLAGGVKPAVALGGFARNLRAAIARPRPTTTREALAFQDRMVAALRAFAGPVLLILSGEDLTAKEFLEYAQSNAAWQGVLETNRIERHDLAEADHTFSLPDASREVELRTLAWLRASVAAHSS